MLTIFPFGISLICPALILGIKRITLKSGRDLGFSIFYAAMILGAVFGGPIVDWIRHDYKQTSWEYIHINDLTGKEETRVEEFSAWRTICFVGFCLNLVMIILLCFYDQKKEELFVEEYIDYGK
jgi:hypothetical protein